MASLARCSIKSVGVIGSGLMGTGISQVAAQAGFQVHLIDSNSSQLSKAEQSITNGLKRACAKKFPEDLTAAKNQFESIMSNLSISNKLSDAVSSLDLIVEAISEQMHLKHDLFKELDRLAHANCLFASNTSSLSLTKISSVIKRPDKFGGLHFFNPVPVMKLVEIVKTDQTSESTFETLVTFAKSLGKTPVTCSDTPGFICNRLLWPYLVESMRLVERGHGTIRDVDTTMKLGAGHPMGPFELCDFVGLDTVKFILDAFASAYPSDPLYACPNLLEQLIAQGKLGRKTGEGFYKYDKQGKILS